ncbi:MAG: hypothetical protein K1X85_12635 [Ignavibacteria bacterium]|nr:hypothetical protein [Ignavibacteria bacterium]
MSLVKEIYDVTKDLAGNKIALNKIRRALLTEVKLNDKFLWDVSDPENRPGKERLIQMIGNLDVTEMKAAITCGLPFELISGRKVDLEMLKNIDHVKALDADLEAVLEKTYLKIAYLKKDYNSESLNLYVRMRNIYNYNKLLNRLLTK